MNDRASAIKSRSAERARERGFTLVEMAVSGALMSIVLVSAYLCFRSALSSQKLIDARQEALQQARVALSLMTADLRNACRLSKEFDFLGMNRSLGDIEADNLDFATHHYTPKKEREADFCEVSYFLEKERSTGIFVLWRRRDPTPDDEPLSGGRREEIARGVLGLRFEYYDGFEWFDEWGDPMGKRRGQTSVLTPSNLSGMPDAVRITLLMDASANKMIPAEAGSSHSSREPPLVFMSLARVLSRPAPLEGGGSPAPSAPGAGPGQPEFAPPTGGPG